VRAWRIEGAFGRENLRLVQAEEAAPARGEVLLDVLAVSLNYRDLLMVEGGYDPRQPLPLVPCSDACCRVAALGEGVDGLAVGERVCPLFAQEWLAGEPTRARLRSTLGGPLPGTLRERLVLPATGVVPAPDHLDDAAAATLPCAGLTAWSALAVEGRVRPGDTVLVLGTGGVAIFALQVARLLGARVVVTSSSDEKLARARELGAWEGINYRREPEWGRRVRQLTGGGADHVVEVGGAGTLAQSLRAVRPGGTISLIGVLAGSSAPLSVTPILMQQVRVQGVLVGHREGLEGFLRAVAQHRLQPVVDRRFPFAEAPEAFAHLAAGRHFGKVVVEVAAGRG
jgi:NADPH:quinone reductase-like Zn-dependent oxidoreductase